MRSMTIDGGRGRAVRAGRERAERSMGGARREGPSFNSVRERRGGGGEGRGEYGRASASCFRVRVGPQSELGKKDEPASSDSSWRADLVR